MKNQRKPKTPRRVILVRVMAIILALLMLAGILAIALPYTSYAAETVPAYTNDIIRIGLMYGNKVTVGFETTTEYGFGMGYIENGTNYTQLYQVTDTIVSVTCDANLSKSAMTYSIGNASNAVIGGWHIQIPANAAGIQEQLNMLSTQLEQYKIAVFPAFINGEYVIRVGNYVNEAAAAEILPLITQLSGVTAYTVSNTNTAVSVVNPTTDKILFEFDDKNGLSFGMTALPGVEASYIVTPAKNVYQGVFEYSRYMNESTNGIAVTNVIPLEDYVAGVLPWEISRTWPSEVLKAFSVTVRSYTMSMLGRHKTSYGFDLCNTTHCQAYCGCGRTNEDVIAAVNATKNIVLTYNGAIAKTYYSSSMGGVSVSVNEAWGGSNEYPYLVAVPTPWENYTEHSNGTWTVEVTPDELYRELYDAGYTQLRGAIESAVINKFATNSSYVFSITFTDVYGNDATIEKTDSIRTALSSYLKSANFVVGKPGDTLTVTEYNYADNTTAPIVSDNTDNQMATVQGNVVLTAGGRQSVTETDCFTVNSVGMSYLSSGASVSVITVNGSSSVELGGSVDSADVPEQTVPPETNSKEIVATTKTVVAEGTPGNFVFIGKGWGHGVGLSQWGAHDLGELGYSWQDILSAYFTGTSFTDYKTLVK